MTGYRINRYIRKDSMFRVMNEYLSKVHLVTDPKLYDSMQRFLTNRKETLKVCINVNYNKYIVDVKLKKYSVEEADKSFRAFLSAIAFPYSSMWVRYNEGSLVRYRFVTGKEDKTAVYMDVLYS